ncbi:MAG: YaaA family protein, partial [Coriobacteriaceae bacterium]|nr:YaaA family protein [Coriobacteriaceae bacterium]
MKLCLILSPAKKMNVVEGPPYVEDEPRFLVRTERLMHALQALSPAELQALWKTSDALTALNVERLRRMDLARDVTAAVIAYEGIAFQHLAASVMDGSELDYLRDHLRILSGFYGVLAPFDGVVPYRLEMGQRLSVDGSADLYAFWGDTLLRSIADEGFTDVVNV